MKTWIPDERNFAYLTWKQVEAIPKETALLVLPTAAIEQHGHHLPLATDTLINNLLLGKALAKLPADAMARATSIWDFRGRCRCRLRRSWRCCAIWVRALRRLGLKGLCSTTRMAATRRWSM